MGQPFTLGQLFTQWDVRLSEDQLGSLTATADQPLKVYVNGEGYAGAPGAEPYRRSRSRSAGGEPAGQEQARRNQSTAAVSGDDHGRVQLSHTTDAATYLGIVADHLGADPVAHSVLLTTPHTRPDPVDPAVPNLWCWAEQEGRVVAAAQHTPPFGAYVSTGDSEALARLAVLLHELRPEVSGVGGMRSAVAAFTAGWPGEVRDEVMASRLYACEAVRPPPPVPGSLRLARNADVGLLRAWVDGFTADTGSPAAGRDEVLKGIAAERLWVWEADGVPVSMAETKLPVAGATRVSLVYTPPAQRRRGWAAACVAEVTALQLQRGLVPLLYADAANPTSNGVYVRIGYRHVADAVDVALRP